ncbi:T9SS type A sorting domain-containing protein [Adhaeribacter soli]|uniref:T9SS type A sorting domain-containing protein n=1 Tax=Adhaeribacter soli TaxID=2607655 RepID=A0A5N1J8U0_9BACT|nr:T9SS type A sorting domain-containing protein [Adhaeribacter soli]KAA9345715.1 T9SS type A sorting domain-containing protein [Adhaeribacter soli]
MKALLLTLSVHTKKCGPLLLAFLIPFILSVQAAAQTIPANDDCAGAILLTPNQACTPVNGNSTGATQSLLACGAGGVADDDVWFKFVATKKQHAIKVTGSAGFDAVLELFSGSCTNLNSISCTDEATTGQIEMTQPANLVPGNTYYIRVYHYKSGSGSGSFTICISDPVNDFCDGATELIPANSCNPVNGNLINSTQSLPACGGTGAVSDIWYKFIATGLAHDITIQPGNSFNLAMEVFSGNFCNSLSSIKCRTSINTNGYTMELGSMVPGQTYYIRAFTTSSVISSRPFTICVKERTLPAGASCGNAIDIPAVPFNSGTQTTCGKGDYFSGHFLEPQFTGEEMIFKMNVTNAPVSYLVKLNKLNAGADALGVAVFKDCPNPAFGPINFVGDSPLTVDSSTVTLKTNGIYYFVVDRVKNTTPCGEFNLEILPNTKAPVNDECINAISLTVGKTCIPFNGTSAYATQSLPGVRFPSPLRHPTVADDDVWFSFVAKSPHHKIVLDGVNAFQFNGVMELFSGSCSNLTSLKTKYSSSGIMFDIDATNLVVGQTYYIRVYDRNVGWQSGSFSICVSELIENDECAGAIALPVQPLNATPTPLLATSAVSTQSLPACGGNGSFVFPNDDVWFKFTATSAYQLIKVVGLDKNGQVGQFNFRPNLELFDGSCSSLNSLICASLNWLTIGEINTTNLIPGNTYYLRVFDTSDDISYDKFTIYVQEKLAPVPGAMCSNAIPISSIPFNSGTQTTCGSGNDYNTLCGGSGGSLDEEMVFKLEITNAPVSYQISLSSQSTVKSLAVFSGCPNPSAPRGNCFSGRYFQGSKYAAITNLSDNDSIIHEIFAFTQNGNYYIVVEDSKDFASNATGTCGTFNLKVTPVSAPVNDNCANAVLLQTGAGCTPVFGTTAGASNLPGSVTCGSVRPGFTDDDVWYKFVATSPSHTITIKGTGGGFWAGGQLYRGSCTGLTPLYCDPGFNPGGTRIIQAENLVPGTTYHVNVFDQRPGYGTTGNFTICVTDGAPRPMGSVCENAVNIPSLPYNSGLQTTCGKGNNYGFFGSLVSSYQGQPGFYGYGEDMVFKFTITNAPVTYNFTLSSPTGWKVMRIYDACPIDLFNGVFDALATGPDTSANANYTFTRNGTYYIITDKWAAPNDPVCDVFRIKIDQPVYFPNDECSGAILLPVTTTCSPTRGSLALATVSKPTYCGSFDRYKDAWYKFIAPASRNVRISVSAKTSIQPQIEMFQDTCGALRSMGCPDWNMDSTLTLNYFKLVPGQTYYFRVLNNATYITRDPDFEVCVTDYPIVANSICSGAVTLPVNAPNVCNAVNGTTTGSFAEPGLQGCSGTADDNAWYKFTATQANHRVQVKGAIGFDPVVEMFTGSCGTFTPVACADNTTVGLTENLDVNGLTIGQTYFVRVYHQLPEYGSGNFSICVQERPLPPINDQCVNAITLAADTICNPVTGTVLNATESLRGCSGTAATDVWYKFTALGPENTITVTNTGDADLVTELLSNSCSAPNSVMCRDTAVASGNEIIKFAGATVGNTYYVRVYAYNQAITNGDFTICVKTNSVRSVIPVAPALSVFCAGEKFRLPFQVFGLFTFANTFQAQLSDSAGNFSSSPVIVGSIATAVSDTLDITLPANSKKSSLYKIRIIGTSPAYTSPVQVPVTINAIPNAPSYVAPPEYCLGETIAPLRATGSNIRWYADAQLNQLLHSGLTFTPPQLTDTTTYYLTQTTTGCESLPAIIKVIVKPRPNTFFAGLDSVYCASTQPITLTPTVAGGTFSGGLVFGNTFIPALSGNHTITYTLTQNGCTATETRKVKVKPSPPALTGGNQTICSGSSVQIGMTPSAGFSYAWTPVAGLSNPLIANPVFTGVNPNAQNDTVVKVLHVTDLVNGCTSTSYLKIVVKGVAPITLPASQSVCADRLPMQLSTSPVGGNWSGNGISATGLFDPFMAGLGRHKLIYTIQQNGCTRSDSTFVTVTPTPLARAGRDTTICAGNSVTLGVPVVAGYAYQWSPGTFLDNPAAAQPVFQSIAVSIPTTFVKTLTVTNTSTGCTSTSQVQITVNPLPVVNAGPDVSLCANAGIYQLNGRPLGGTWTGSASISGTAFDPAMAPVGINRLAYTFDLNGCAVTDSVNITVLAAPMAFAGKDSTICSGEGIALGTAPVSGVAYQWSPVTGLSNPFISNPAFSLPNHTVQNDTLVKVLTATNFATGCISRDSVTIIVKPMPVVSAGSDLTVCSNAGPVPLAPTPSGGSWSGSPAVNGSVFDPAVATIGLHHLAYTFSANGCTVTDSLLVTVRPAPVANAGADATICSGETIQLGSAGLPGFSYSWLPANGLNNVNISNPTFTQSNHTVQADTVIKVLTVTNLATNCSSTDTVQIIVKPVPVVSAGANASVCANSGLYQLTPTPAGGTWNGSPHVTGNTFDPLTAGAGLHKLVYTFISNGCTVKDSIEIMVKPTPVALAGSDQIICSGATITLGSSPTPGYGYIWSPATGLSNNQLSNPTFTHTNFNPLADTLIKVLRVTDFATGCSSTDSVRIIVKPNPVIAAVKDTTVCISAGMLTLSGSPSGGTWSGSNALNGNSFNLTAAGAGKHPLVYTFNQNGCPASTTTTVTIQAVPAKPVINLINLDSLGSSVTGTTYQWLLNGKALTANAPGIKPKEYGMYRVIVWNALCISDTSAAYHYQPVDLPLQPEGFRLYPNPSAGKTKLEFRQPGTQAVNLTIFDSIGRPFYKKRLLANAQGIINEELQLRSLRNGIYLLQLTDGSKTWIKKLVIEK